MGNILCKHEPIDMIRASVLSNSIHMNAEFDCHNSIQETSEITCMLSTMEKLFQIYL